MFKCNCESLLSVCAVWLIFLAKIAIHTNIGVQRLGIFHTFIPFSYWRCPYLLKGERYRGWLWQKVGFPSLQAILGKTGTFTCCKCLCSGKNLQIFPFFNQFSFHEEGYLKSSLYMASSLTRVTSVKSVDGIFTHQSHISQVSRRQSWYLAGPVRPTIKSCWYVATISLLELDGEC